MLNKKGDTNWFMVRLIIGLCSLFLLFSYIISILNNQTENFITQECDLLFSQGLSQGIFYDSGKTNFNERFFKFSEENCKYFDYEIKESNINLGVESIYSCYEMLTQAQTNLPKEMYGGGICYYCGNLEIESSSLDKFNTELNKKFNENEIISNFEIKNKESSIFFFEIREDIGYYDSILSKMDSYVSQGVSTFNIKADLFSNDAKIYRGITFGQNKIEEINGEEVNNIYVNNKLYSDEYNCKTIVPLNKVSN